MDLTLDDFRGEFDELAFLDKLVSNVKQRSGAQANDPAPYQAAFSKALNAIDSLERAVNNEIQKSTTELIEIDRDHKGNLAEHAQTLELVIEKFAKLDQTISSVAQTAVRIGDQLESIDKAKHRSMYGSKMISYFLSMNSEQPTIPGFLKNPKFEELNDAANTIQALQHAAQDLSRIPNTEDAFKNISNVAGEIENRLLKEFEHAWEEDNLEGMKQCAAPLLSFEGGHLIARFIAKCTGNLTPVSVIRAPESLEQFNSQVSRLFDAINDTCEKHFRLIVDVFPSPDKIIRQLIERIYEDNIAGFLENGLNATTMNGESYVIALEVSYDLNRKLVRELTSLIQELQLRETIVVAVNLTLQDHSEGLFCQYRENFITRQLDVFYKDVKQRIDAVLAINPISTERGSGLSGSSGGSQIEMSILDWIHDIFETSVFESILGSCQLALARCDKLCDAPRLPDVIRRIFKTFLDASSKLFLFRLADNLINAVAEDSSESAPESDTAAVQYIGEFDRLIQKLEDFFQSEISRRMQESLNLLQKSVKEKQEVVQTLEQKLLVVLSNTLDLVIQHSTRQLSRLQQKSDFRPKEDSVLPDGSGCSTAAAEVVAFLNSHSHSVISHLRGKNLDQYLLVLGIRIHEVLSAHLKSFTISNAGALLLMRDIREYQECIREFHIIPVIDKFETLRHIANVFAVPPEGLKSLIDDDPYLAPNHVSKEELHTFIKLRVDYKQSNLRRMLQQ